MPLPKDQLTTLKNLLKECSAEVKGDDGSRGTGFFIDDRLLLTCSHVVGSKKNKQVEVFPHRREMRNGTIVSRIGDKTVDLALVETDFLDEEPLPSVLLDAGLEDDIEYFAVGYPQDKISDGRGIEAIGYVGHERTSSVDGGSVQSLKFEAGKGNIKPGLSGGAVLNPETGAVVALVQSSESSTGIAGGGSIPIALAADRLGQVAERLDKPPSSSRRWREALGKAAWLELGKPPWWKRSVDLELSGNRTSWKVRIAEKEGTEFTVNRLPDETPEAVFHWAQRSSISDEADIQLLGKLLAGAIFPDEIEATLKRESLADELLIRIRIDPDSELFDIPWEFATLEIERDRCHVGAHKRLGLVRVADKPAVNAPPVAEGARVVASVVQLDDLQAPIAPLGGGGQATWPEGKTLKDLEEAVGSTRFELAPEDNPVPGAMMAALTDPPPPDTSNAIAHYIGRGQMYGGNPCIAVSDGLGSIDWHDLNGVCKWVADSGARFFIVELTPPPLGTEPDPIPPRTFLKALDGGVEAVLFTRFPVHPHHLWGFNKALYKALNEGETVEIAVQKARNDTFVNRFLGKVAEFGWFTLITGKSPGMCVVQPPDEDRITSERSGGRPTKRPSGDERKREPAADGASRDAFAKESS